jgi:hypothetical protein
VSRTTKILRLLVAAMIGAGIALLLYLFLLRAVEHRIPKWVLGPASVALYCIFYYGSIFLIKKAKP